MTLRYALLPLCLLAALRPSCAGLVLAACQFFPCFILFAYERQAEFQLFQVGVNGISIRMTPRDIGGERGDARLVLR